MASGQGVPGQDLSHRKTTLGSRRADPRVWEGRLQGVLCSHHPGKREASSTQETVLKKPVTDPPPFPTPLTHSFQTTVSTPLHPALKQIKKEDFLTTKPSGSFLPCFQRPQPHDTWKRRRWGWSGGKEACLAVTRAARWPVTGLHKPT